MLGYLRYVSLFSASILLLAGAVCASEAVERYLASNTSLKEGKRILDDFDAPLSAEVLTSCLEFLRHTFPEDEVAIGRVRQNDLADWLIQQPAHTEACTIAILEVVAAENADLLWREFCIQKLALALEQASLSEESTRQCLNTLIEKASDTRISFSGSALLGLYRLSKKDAPLVEPSKVASLAEHVVESPDFAGANKVTALQVAGLSGSEKAVHLARKYAGDESMPMQLRVSAVALLGNAGDESDLTELKKLTRSLDFRLRKAAEGAISNLTKT